MSQIEDVEAIHGYLLNQPTKTKNAETVRVQTLEWYERGGFWDRNMSTDWYNDLRTRRNQFNLANAVSPAEKAKIEQVLATGITTEEMQGKARPAINVKTGVVGKPASNLSAGGQPTLTRVLKKGLSGNDVKVWQSFLSLTPPTGYFDALTDSKTRKFQSSKKLTADGAVGKNTWNAAFPIAKEATIPIGAKESDFTPPPAVSPVASGLPKKPASRTARSASVDAPPATKPPFIPPMIKAGINPAGWSMPAKVLGAAAGIALAGGALMKHHGHK
jgi:peptidoglycan hydrolase-like protein with peptidoglycan-binding domain